MKSDEELEILKQVQQKELINLFKKELSEQMKCDSESSYYICEQCNCWKMARILHDVDRKNV
jgi:hypothetical protein